MSVNPAEYWSTAVDPRRIRKWARQTRRKMRIWRAAIAMSLGLKRGIDILAASFGIILALPILLFVSAWIKIEDRGPIFYGQERIGQGGRVFRMWKFRSMVVNADSLKAALTEENQHGDSGVTFKMKNDPRITKIGKWLRKLSLDELPQLWNVLRGDMALVGPRPPVPQEVAEYKSFHLRRLKARPGITCLWQIGGRSEIDFEGQVRLDLEYIRSVSIWKDIWILLKTVPAVLFGKGAY